MNISAPFIRRPVATSLLAAALLLAGIAGVPEAAGRAAAARRLPDHPGERALPGASPETMASSVATPLERRFGRIAGLTEMTSTSTLGVDVDHAAVRSRPQRRRGRARRPGGHRGRRRRASAQPAAEADVPEGQPGRRAHPHPLADQRNAAARAGVRRGQHHPRAEDLAGARRRAGVRRRRPAARRARPVRPAGPRRAWASSSADVRAALSGPPRATRPRAPSRATSRRRSIGANDQLFDAAGYAAARHRAERQPTSRSWATSRSVYDERREQPRRRLGRRQAGGPRCSSASRPDANIIETNERVMALAARSWRSRSRPAIKMQIAQRPHRRPSARRSTDVEKTLVISVVLVVRRRLRLPALRARHAGSRGRDAAVAAWAPSA